MRLIYKGRRYLNSENKEGNTPFMEAFLAHNFAAVDVMRDEGVDINFKNSKGKRIIDIAKDINDEDIIEYIRKYKLVNMEIENLLKP